jgi:hypothetical protein
MSRLRALGGEGGFSLVFTLMTMLVTSVTLTAAIQYTTSNSSSSTRSKKDQIAYALAEAGLANGAAVLSKPGNNALDPTVLPSSEPDEANPAPEHANYVDELEGGTVKWWGELTGTVWIMHGLGIVEDPTGRTVPVIRHATSTIKIQPTLTQDLNSNAWNYMFAKDTANACDVTFANAVQVDSSMFILGDLCLTNSASIVKAADPELTRLVVGQHVHFGGTGTIGSTANPIAEAHIAGGCRVGGVVPGTSGETWTAPCTSGTRVHAGWVTADTLVNDGGPTADFDFWYTNAKPGPAQACSTSSGTPPTFESPGSTTPNNSVSPAFNLTPSASYSCKYYDIPPASDLLGELSWDSATKTLIIKGVTYIDGSVYVSNNSVNRYVGQGTLYLSGTFDITGNSELCGGVTGGHCDFAAWDPNDNNLGIIADGDDVAGYSVKLQNQARLQASIYATNAVLLENQTKFDGPMVAGTFTLENNVETHEFPTITSVPIGWPGNPTVYAEPQPPSNYSG